LSWVLVEGPKLDKTLLQFLENDGLEQPIFPPWLSPLWDLFIANRDADILRDLRQILVFCYKAEFEPTKSQLDFAFAKFISTDEVVGVWNKYFLSTLQTSHVFRSARQYVGAVVYRINWSNISPSHGPGAVFPPCAPCDKSKFDTIYESIQAEYPFDQFFCGIPSFWDAAMRVGSPRLLTETNRIVSKVSAVPKDSRGPRLICVHPKGAIWIQQGQRRLLEQAIATNRLTSGKINFTDQKINGSLALQASKSREYLTLDLSEASDRIGCELVNFLFGGASRWLNSARSDYYQIGNVVRRFHKYAPMGNCNIFPIQSLIFWSLVRAGIRCRHGVNCDDIYVFGDDIVLPTKYYDAAIYALTMAGLVPNMDKTFRKGFFRESCGVDAYNGIDVTPLRLRRSGITSIQDAVSVCDLAKRLRLKQFHICSAYLYSQVNVFLERLLKNKRYGRILRTRGKYSGILPLCSNPNAQGLYEYTSTLTPIIRSNNFRFNPGLQRLEVGVLLVLGRVFTPKEGDWSLLQDSLLRIREDPISERGTTFPIPYGERLSYGWINLQ